MKPAVLQASPIASHPKLGAPSIGRLCFCPMGGIAQFLFALLNLHFCFLSEPGKRNSLLLLVFAFTVGIADLARLIGAEKQNLA
jgi:hypothetical protein